MQQTRYRGMFFIIMFKTPQKMTLHQQTLYLRQIHHTKTATALFHQSKSIQQYTKTPTIYTTRAMEIKKNVRRCVTTYFAIERITQLNNRRTYQTTGSTITTPS
ncbi:hypothetical protein F4225_12170 [Candidatus Poribacteria bacterium]|nr:hypothetical protein [Candidatus Poribacteria bacterium]